MAEDKAQASLLILIGEAFTEGHASLILNRVTQGLSAWNQNARGFANYDKPQIDLNTELRNFLNKKVESENVATGGFLLRYKSANLYLEVLLTPSVQTAQSSLSHFLTYPAAYRHVIHAGAAFAGNGSWILQDGTLSMHDFSRLLHRADITTALTEITPDSSLIVSCFPEGEWNERGVKHHGLDKLGHIYFGQLSGNANIDASCAGDLQAYLRKSVTFTPLDNILPASTVVGSVRFRHPTLHIFPAGQGDAALFGVNGFTILLDGGFGRKTCFWDFLRHVDRVDALLITRLNNSNYLGVSSLIEHLAISGCHPKLGYAFGNIPSHQLKTTSEQQHKDPLLLCAYEEGAKICDNLEKLNLKLHPCVSSIGPTAKHPEPLTLYQKVGEGRLDMYVLNPSKDSKEFNEFMDLWKKGVRKQGSLRFSTKPGATGVSFPASLVDDTSIAALFIWRPSNPHEQIIRVLFPGSCPQEKVLLGLDKLKHLDVLKHSTCSATSSDASGTKTAASVSTAAKKHVAAKHVEPTKQPAALVSPKSQSGAAPSPGATKPTVAAAAVPAVLATVAPVDPMAAGVIAHEQAAKPPPSSLETKEPVGYSAGIPSASPLLDLSSPAANESSPPSHENVLSQDRDPLSGGEENVVAFTDPNHRDKLAQAAEPDLFGSTERHHAGFSVAAEPMTASPFEVVDVNHPVEPSVLRLSTDQLREHSVDDTRSNIEASPNQSGDNTQQKGAENLMDSPIQAREAFGAGDTIRGASEKFGHEWPDSPSQAMEVGQPMPPQLSPESQQRNFSALNPEAPVFVPTHFSPTGETGFESSRASLQQQHGTSLLDPFSSIQQGTQEQKLGFDSFSNGSANLLDDGAWQMESNASPKRAGGFSSSAMADESSAAQLSPEDQRKKVEEAMKEWGEPLGLPAPTPPSKGAQPGATATKPKANGPSSANKENASKTNKPSVPASGASTAKRTTAATTKPPTSSSSAKSPLNTKPASASSTLSKKSPAAATSKTGAAGATKTTTAKPVGAAATKVPSSGRAPTTATAAPKTAAASTAKSAASTRKPGPPPISYYVDLTYIPHQGNPNHCNAEFFKHVRAKHYVLSTLNPSKEILESLLAGKKAWNLPEEEVTLIPTYDSDTLTLWMNLHKDELASESIDVAPSCCRCTVNLEEQQGAKCAAYRLEL